MSATAPVSFRPNQHVRSFRTGVWPSEEWGGGCRWGGVDVATAAPPPETRCALLTTTRGRCGGRAGRGGRPAARGARVCAVVAAPRRGRFVGWRGGEAGRRRQDCPCRRPHLCAEWRGVGGGSSGGGHRSVVRGGGWTLEGELGDRSGGGSARPPPLAPAHLVLPCANVPPLTRRGLTGVAATMPP